MLAPMHPLPGSPSKREQKLLVTLSGAQISTLVKFTPPKAGNIKRAHVGALAILDTGLRADELLKLSDTDIDFENLMIKVKGKGNKHRRSRSASSCGRSSGGTRAVEAQAPLSGTSSARRTIPPSPFGTSSGT